MVRNTNKRSKFFPNKSAFLDSFHWIEGGFEYWPSVLVVLKYTRQIVLEWAVPAELRKPQTKSLIKNDGNI